MADSNNQSSSSADFSSAPQGPHTAGPWLPMAMGAALIVVLLVMVAYFGRSRTSAANQIDPYTANLVLSKLHMAEAENFAGGKVTYIDGILSNTGDKRVTGARVEVIFKNSIGEVTQKEVLPVMVLLPNLPYTDYGTIDRAPVAPRQARDFRLTLEHVTADWDTQIPGVRVVAVSY